MIRSAIIDSTGTFRYHLSRTWAPLFRDRCIFIMLNPSTADGAEDDPTIRRCIGFARSWGCGGMDVVNLFAVRSPIPAFVLSRQDRVGPENDRHIRQAVTQREVWRVVAAWGMNGRDCPGRVAEVMALIDRDVHCLGVTQEGHPKHPLYVPADTPLIPYLPEAH